MASRLILTGFRSIEECLKKNPDRIAKILFPTGKLTPRQQALKELAAKMKVRVEQNPTTDPSDEPVLALMNDYQYVDFDGLVDELREQIQDGKRPMVVVLDGITDPNNLGAILRTAAFMGASGVVLPKDRAAAINETVYRIASGGLEYLQVAQVTNVVQALKSLKDAGFWIMGFSEHAEQTLSELRRDFPPVLIIGNEEKGMRPLVKENCDFLVRLESKTGLLSLNASVAAGLAMAWATDLLSPNS